MFTIRCLVDNKTLDSVSLQAEHGLSLAIETPGSHLLFDTGKSGDVLLQNAARMGYNLRQVDALALSHAHHDHTGGLKALMHHSMPGLPLHAHADIFRQRFTRRDGGMQSIGLQVTRSELAQHFTLHLGTEASEILPHIWTTGEIIPRKEFEGRSSNHHVKDGEAWLPDPYRDDISLILEGGSGLILVCGCCHAGLLNTLAQVQRMFSREVAAIIGGTHLGAVDDEGLQHVIEVVRTTCGGGIPDFYLDHCTGDRAIAALAAAFGDKVHAFPVGTVLAFD